MAGSDWAHDQWPDDDGPDSDWPDGWSAAAGGDEAHWRAAAAVPSEGGSGRRTLALALTAAIALGAGAGAVYLYQNPGGGAAQTMAEPGASDTTGPSSPTRGTPASVTVLGQVLAVGHNAVTIGGGPLPSISARVTGATRFTGADWRRSGWVTP